MIHRDHIIAGFFVSLLFGSAVVFGLVIVRQHQQIVQQNPTPKKPSIRSSDPVRGAFDAPVTIIEYGDFQCPYCQSTQNVLATILSKYKNTVRVVWKDFPLTSQHPEAEKAAEAARCAQEQGQFWQMHDLLFTNQEKLGATFYSDAARQLNLVQDQFATCLSSHTELPLIQADIQEGSRAAVDGTPYFFVNNLVLKNVVTVSQLEQAIALALR